VFGDSGRLERGPGTVIEVTKDDEATTPRAYYKYMKRKYYGRSI
tara:strand:- start:284 stop:415 length:132 start_codon:yes stop_codon:yes gene_type:complete